MPTHTLTYLNVMHACWHASVPHSHDDMGWLKDVDQDYYGTNESIQVQSSRLSTINPPPRLHVMVSTSYRVVGVHAQQTIHLETCLSIQCPCDVGACLLQVAAVHYILDTVIQGLADNPDRRFTFAEQGFFQRWWHTQTNATQAMTRRLVANGQLAFVGGGWTQHDEGCTTYREMIDQMTIGHRFLEREFGCVRWSAYGLS